MAAVYDYIARLIPTEGRDYSLEFSFPNDRVSVRMVPYTKFGKVWCDYCREELFKAGGRK